MNMLIEYSCSYQGGEGEQGVAGGTKWIKGINCTVTDGVTENKFLVVITEAEM